MAHLSWLEGRIAVRATVLANPSGLVLDTNAVLDWLVFADPMLFGLTEALNAGQVRLVGHPAIVDELRRVLGYPALKLDSLRQSDALARYQSHLVQPVLPTEFSDQNLLLPEGFPRCRDLDDQIFLALAYHTGAVLLSRDKAVLKLAKRTRRFGVHIISPQQLAQWLTAA